MSAVPTGSLACQRDPDRWFNPHDRTRALERCLHCPARARCAAEALRVKARFGMWAGIWIDNNLAQMATYLTMIAAPTVASPQPADPTSAARAPHRESRHHRPSPAHGVSHVALHPPRPDQSAQHSAPQRCPGSSNPTIRSGPPGLPPHTAVEVRSSAHCEIMAPGCRYTLDAVRSRIPGLTPREARSAAALYAACAPCRQIIGTLELPIAARLGYILTRAADPATVPFYWRQAQWVLFERDGLARATA